jgi:DNA-binding Xre family transcriptional regulator
MITYNKLFHMMVDRKIKTGQLLKDSGISAPTLTRLRNDGIVDTKTIDKLCKALNCQPGDLMTYTEGDG